MRKHNHVAILLLVIFHQILGFLWYGVVFLAPRMEAMKGQPLTPAVVPPIPPVAYVMDFLGGILTCYALSWLLGRMDVTTLGGGIKTGLIVFLGIVFAAVAPHYKFLFISDTVLWIDLAQLFVYTLVVSSVLSVWRKKGVTA